jgi:eukaryotic-like serine/threonine-protein kinase
MSKAKSKPTPEEEKLLRAAETEVPQTLSLELSSETWDALEICLERFTKAWQESPEHAPHIETFLPERPGLRQVAIVELIKLDMEQRHAKKTPTTIEDYAARFPELGGVDRMPVELIYEEFLVRRQSTPDLKVDEYLVRYPKRAAELKSLAAVHEGPVQDPPKSTSITSLRRPDVLQVGERVDDFDLLALLGQGSFAKVFLARQLSLQRLVALKISAARGFESQTLAQLDHPNIVRVYDQRRLPERNMQLLYMQYMPGGTLSDVVQRVKRTPAGARSSQILLDVLKDRLNEQGEGNSDLQLPSAIRGASWWMTVTWLGRHLAAALDPAHAKGVLHRDLKPANVLLGRDGNPRLADFNVSASTVVASHVSAAYFGGSLAYMSPEQLEAFGAPAEQREAMMDARSDVFSLGILLWEVLMGARPFRDEQITDLEVDTLVSLANKRRTGPTPEDWKTLTAVAPPGLVAFFRTCLAAKPEDRFANAAAARRALVLCGSESSRNLLQPQAESLIAKCRRWPIVPLILAGLVPNLISSGLNIIFNYNVIINHLTAQAEKVLGIPYEQAYDLVWGAFKLSMLTINSVAYSAGILVGVAFALPVALAAARADRGEPASAEMRYRSIWLPDVVALLTAGLWVLSGPAFPWVLAQKGVFLKGWDFVHFSASQAICGILAASLAFMFTAPIVLRVILPSLLDAKQDDPVLHEKLQGLSSRSLVVVFASFLVMLLSTVLWTYAESEAKPAFVVFLSCSFMLGAFCFFVLKPRIIDPDIAALQATTMIDESTGGDTQSSLAATSRRARK